MADTRGSARFSIPVLAGAALRASAGANAGDTLAAVDDLSPGDVYRLAADSVRLTLLIEDTGPTAPTRDTAPVLRPDGGPHRIAEASEAGSPGAVIALAARLTFLAPDGHSVDVMALQVTSEAAEAFLFPMGPIQAGLDYTLVGIAMPDSLPQDALRLADIAPFGFASGTRITMADGTQRPVERLALGDRVLTRDSGPQPLCKILTYSTRALGPDAPVVIAANTMGNPGDLILSPHQRLLIYQRGDDRLTETAELLVRAQDLVDDTQVFVRDGGFVSYVSLVLERHEMLFAECVAVESLEVGDATRHRLTDAHARELEGVSHIRHYGTEAGGEIASAARARLKRRRD